MTNAQEIENEEVFEKESGDIEEVDITEVLGKINERLEFLEKKLDRLIEQSEGRGNRAREGQPRHFREHRKPFGRPFRHPGVPGGAFRPQHGRGFGDQSPRPFGGGFRKKRFGGGSGHRNKNPRGNREF